MPPERRSHPILGTLRGQPSINDRVLSYRGTKYVEIIERWADSKLLSHQLSEPEYDATNFGPQCPQHASAQGFDVSLVADVELPANLPPYDEFECLNLVVTVPARVHEGARLPVMVWVHGYSPSDINPRGTQLRRNREAFSMHGRQLLAAVRNADIEPIVARSVEIGKPMIGVAINYRIGIFGFLVSEEMGIQGNFGPAMCFSMGQVTAVGESAGGISISTLLVAGEGPFFSKAIIISGDPTLRKPRRTPWHNQMYAKNLKMLGLECSSPKERRVRILRTMPSEELVSRLAMAQYWYAVIDGKFLKDEVHLGKPGAGITPWVNKVGGTVFKTTVLDNPTVFDRLQSAADKLFDEQEKYKLLAQYVLTPVHDESTRRSGLMELLSDLRFYLPTIKVAEGWPEGWPEGKCHTYHFHQLNPIVGAFFNRASHELDVAFVLQNFNKHFPDKVVKSAQRVSDI
ncbi:hypothetical protein AJ80_06896 [Polytolypa hystricis UAMH7299]|uniref:Carboxylesterase type B domain-containing protein n=1 Tax=Polytolypa hystricis (strain UAMH7299) TaxID=1447883 RepID=A0A2B7XT39_POLH7|nr:hypothetical protein AJ80_06896 [Polytolypa hystricis UAMH7299]